MKKLLDKVQFQFRRGFIRQRYRADNLPPAADHTEADEALLTQRPYPGLNSYNEDREDYFYGRDTEKKNILEILEYYSLCFLIGKSGIGKSSLINAGLVPELRRRDFAPVMIRINFDDDTHLAEQVKTTIVKELRKVDSDVPDFGNRLLWEYFQEVKLFNGFMKPVLVFDQFEEIFTRGSSKEQELTSLLRELIDLSENRVPEKVQQAYIDSKQTIPSDLRKDYRLIFVLREDYLPQLTGLRIYIPTLRYSVFRLEQLNAAQALEAIYRPAEKAGLMDYATAVEIYNKIPNARNDEYEFSLLENGQPGAELKDQTENKRIEPFLLNLFCYTLNEDRLAARPPRKKITTRDVTGKNLNTLVSDYYEEITGQRAGLSLAIEEELITPEGKYRKFSAKGNFEKAGNISDDDINYLISNKLVRRRTINNLEYFELIHDILIPVVVKKRKLRRRTKRITYAILFAVAMFGIGYLLLQLQLNERERKLKDAQNDLTLKEQQLTLKLQQDEIRERSKKDSTKRYTDSVDLVFKTNLTRKEKDSLELEKLNFALEQEKTKALTEKDKRDRDSALIQNAKNQLDYFDNLKRMQISLVLSKESQKETYEPYKNTLALMAYDTLYSSKYRPREDSFKLELYKALFDAADIRPSDIALKTLTESNYRTIDAALPGKQLYFVRPFAGIITQDGSEIITDTNLVHAWISRDGNTIATLTRYDNTHNRLLVKNMSNRLLHNPILLGPGEDVISVLFDQGGNTCIFSTRTPRRNGTVKAFQIKGLQPVQTVWLGEPNEYLFLDYKSATSFTGVSNKGRIFTGPELQTGVALLPSGRSRYASAVTAISSSANNNILVIAHEHGEIYIHGATGKTIDPDNPQQFRLSAIAAGSQGKYIATGNVRGNIQLWILETGQQPFYVELGRANTYAYQGDGIVQLLFTEKDQLLIAVTESGRIYRLPVSVSTLAKKICETKLLLKPAEWSNYISNTKYKDLCR